MTAGKNFGVTKNGYLFANSGKIGNMDINAIAGNLVGGNLLLNSSFSQNLDQWNTSGINQETDGINDSCMRVDGAFNITKTVWQDIINVIDWDSPGKTYTYSAEVKLENWETGTTNCYVALYGDGYYTNGDGE
jgi:hypothetical protein